MIREPYPDYYTTPPDWNGCKNLVKNGTTPCWHPHCECFPETKVDWAKPEGCHCDTLRQRAGCYENCDAEPLPSPKVDSPLRRLTLWTFVVAVILTLGFLFVKPAPAAELPKQPKYCAMFEMLPRTCTAARVVVKMYGKEEAERRARTCGATEDDIAQATLCLAQHGE